MIKIVSANKTCILRLVIAVCFIFLLASSAGCSQPDISRANSDTTASVANSEDLAPAKTEQTDSSQDNTSDQTLEVVFLDVGQADATYLEQGNHRMIIDGGNRADSSLIYSFLNRRNITQLDYVINSHPDEDHVGGLAGAYQIADVLQSFSSVQEHDTRAFNNYKDAVQKQARSIIVPETNRTISLGEAEITFIQPDKDYQDTNADSLVVRVVFGNTSFLFTGDINETAEKDLAELSSGFNIESTVLKVPHHGSKYSSSYIFLRAVNPQYSVVSVGKNNSYGHPTEEALSRYKDQGSTLYRTDLHGDITMFSDGNNVTATTSKSSSRDVFVP